MDSEIERELVLKIGEAGDVISKAIKTLEPIAICKYLLDLAQLFNNFYHKCPVVTAERNLAGAGSAVAGARLFLAKKVGEVLTNGLRLLNIEVVEEM
jgi:arginyl-tRNA synthetase